jgi:hypothetical protein
MAALASHLADALSVATIGAFALASEKPTDSPSLRFRWQHLNRACALAATTLVSVAFALGNVPALQVPCGAALKSLMTASGSAAIVDVDAAARAFVERLRMTSTVLALGHGVVSAAAYLSRFRATSEFCAAMWMGVAAAAAVAAVSGASSALASDAVTASVSLAAIGFAVGHMVSMITAMPASPQPSAREESPAPPQAAQGRPQLSAARGLALAAASIGATVIALRSAF